MISKSGVCVSAADSAPRASRLGVLVLVPVIAKEPVAPYAPTSPQPQSSATAAPREKLSVWGKSEREGSVATCM